MMERALQSKVNIANQPGLASVGLLQRECACGKRNVTGECEGCSQKKKLFKKSVGAGRDDRVPPSVNEVLLSEGHQLDTPTRSFFERRFLHDFSQVRVHNDARAAESAQDVSALAYTVGRHIVFDSSQYAPGTTTGLRLLAHELTHVVQQDTGLSGKAHDISSPGDSYEREADRVADQVAQGSTATVTGESGPRVSRDDEPQREWGGFYIRGEAAFVNAVRADLNRLNGTTTGAAVLREISEYTSPIYRSRISISPESSCGFLPNSGIKYAAGGCNVGNNCRNSVSNWNEVPNFVYLYHEIVHVYLYHIRGQGTHAGRGCMVTGLGRYFTDMPHNENRLRCELGLPIRPCYDGECRLPAPTCPRAEQSEQSEQRRDVGATHATMIRPWRPRSSD